MAELTELQKQLFELQDIKYRDFHSKLMPETAKEKIIGIRTPVLRNFAKVFAGTPESEDFLQQLPHQFYEENNLHMMLITGIKDYPKCMEEVQRFLTQSGSRFTTEQLEEAMQTVMDAYAGGIKTNYRFNEKQLKIADEKIVQLMQLSEQLHADDFQELMYIYELRERLVVCRSVIAHLKARQETRWHSFAENLDYPEKDDVHWRKYVNSKLENGELKIILRDLVEGGQTYEHCH